MFLTGQYNAIWLSSVTAPTIPFEKQISLPEGVEKQLQGVARARPSSTTIPPSSPGLCLYSTIVPASK